MTVLYVPSLLDGGVRGQYPLRVMDPARSEGVGRWLKVVEPLPSEKATTQNVSLT